MVKSNHKPVKHGKLFCQIDHLVREHKITLYFKKTKGHSKVIGEEKEGNDQADTLAKEEEYMETDYCRLL